MGKVNTTRARWVEGHRFVVTTGSGHAMVLDNPGREDGAAASPMEMVLAAAAGCTGIDVVAILEKMRQPLESLEVEVTGTRREEHPRVYTAVEITYRVRGEGLDPKKVLRAVALSEERYCSVTAMLRPAVEVRTVVEVNGERL